MGPSGPPVEPVGAPEADAEAPPPEAPPEAPEGASEVHADQNEWRPVVGGDQIEWQPVVVPEERDDATPERDEGDPTEAVASEALEPEPVAEPAPPVPEPQPEPEPVPGDAVPDEAAVASEGAAAGGPDFDYPPEASEEEIALEADTEPETEWDDTVTAETPSTVPSNGAAATAAGAGARTFSSRRRPESPPPDDEDEPDPKAKLRRQVILLSVLTGAIVAVAIVAFVLSRSATKAGEEAQATTTVPPTNTIVTLPESAFTTFRDDQTGFTIKYPRTWERLQPPVADIRLVTNAGGYDGFRIRVAPIEVPATVENIGNFKAVTDTIAFGDRSAKLIQEQLVTLNGLLAYYYLYTFQDPITNQEGIHAHYFVFEGLRMFMINFQTIPTEEFVRQAGIFDQIAESFT
ncbi:MAG: photosystem II reaction center PsbP family protein, partial [Actinobacteria bacterium]|nr:photosystem II reaction center PsbP family protein [Actinomycetota bacterium]